MDLYLDLDRGELRLGEVSLISSPAPRSSDLKSGYKIEIRSPENEIRYQSYFRDPRVVFYDIADTSTLALSGGIFFKDQNLFKIRIPFSPEAESVSIFDPEGNLKFQTSMNQLVSRVSKTLSLPTWEVDTLVYNGDPSNRIDIVFLGDGYTADDMAVYSNNVQDFIAFMFNYISPFNEYRNYFNVYQVNVISQESGSDHLETYPPIYRNTALGTYYGCGGIDRLICADDAAVYAAAQSVPWYDAIAVLVNDPTYGGSGGGFLVTYNGSLGPYVFMHELGHSFAELADEYLYGNYPGSVSSCNCDENSSDPRWQSWIGIGSLGVGTFLGCSYNNLYRPTSNSCMMNSLQGTYCVVCREQTVRSIYRFVRAYDGFSPSSDTLTIDTLSHPFELFTLVPDTHPLEVNWLVDGLFVHAGNPFNFTPSSAGLFNVRGTVHDPTDMVLDDPQNLLSDSKNWQVDVSYFLCGDPDQDSKVTVSDVVFLINYLFKSGPEPVPRASGDVDLDQEVTLSDVIYLANYLFKAGSPPCSS